MKLYDIFEVNDFFENGNMIQVQIILVVLVGLVKIKGFYIIIDIGVKYVEK